LHFAIPIVAKNNNRRLRIIAMFMPLWALAMDISTTITRKSSSLSLFSSLFEENIRENLKSIVKNNTEP